MATTIVTFAAPAVPLGFDSGLPDESILELPLLPDMTTDPQLFLAHDAYNAHHVQPWSLESPIHQSQPSSEPARSPGMTGSLDHPPGSTDASSSRSPASLVLTPASTQLDYSGDAPASESGRQDDSDYMVISPISNISPFTDDSVFARHFGGGEPLGMDPNNPQDPYRRAQASSFAHPPLSSAPQTSSQQSRASSIAPSDAASSFHHYSSFATATATSGAWADQPDAHYTYFQDTNATTYPLTDPTVAVHDFTHDGLTGLDPPLFRPVTQQEWLLVEQDTFHYPLAQQAGPHVPNPAYIHPRQYSHPTPSPSSRIESPASSGHGTDNIRPHHRSEPSVPTQSLAYLGARPPIVPSQHSNRPRGAPISSSNRAGAITEARHAPPSGRAIKPAEKAHARNRPGPAPSSASASASSSQASKPRGGRQRHSHLPDPSRKKISNMRKTGACWRCVLQRDPCPDGGTPCQRCINRAEKNTLNFFPCDRSKLPELILDFLPPTMTFMHSKQSIEDTVKNQVAEWDLENSVDVYFTCGYGPALKWRLYEFKPRTPQLLGQLQYLQHTRGKTTGTRKYSPPFALTHLDTTDDERFDRYLDTLLGSQFLGEFPWTCFEEETEEDDFQARLLEWLCRLYQASERDYDLHALLGKILRMMLITYIMGHTLTICEETLSGVLDSVKHTPRGEAAPHTSPRLANRQLKFYFSLMRNSLYLEVLNWLQQTLHASGRKDTTWLSSFCVIVGVSMVLEEIERTIFIQADAKMVNHQMSHEDAHTEAVNACERVDRRHQLLVGLFQCKYRDRSWKTGSFGQGTPELKNVRYRQHVEGLFELLEEKQDRLQHRKDIPLHEDTQCHLTTRLVARFLLPFLGTSANTGRHD